MGIYYGGDQTSPGVEKQLLPQNTDAAARQASAEQAGEDIFKPQDSPDVDALVARLNELEEECNQAQMKLWGPPHSMDASYKGPPYMERERLQRKLDALYEEKSSIQAQLRTILDATNFDAEPAGPYVGNAKVIY